MGGGAAVTVDGAKELKSTFVKSNTYKVFEALAIYTVEQVYPLVAWSVLLQEQEDDFDALLSLVRLSRWVPWKLVND